MLQEIIPKELRPDPGSNTESPEERPTSSTLRRQSDNRSIKSNDSIKASRKLIDKVNIIHPLNFSVSDLQNSPKASTRTKKKKEDNTCIQMKDLTLTRSPAKVHRKQSTEYDNSATLKRVNDTVRETDSDSLRRGLDAVDFKYADETSESSNEIRFADDSPDSNRLIDKYDAKA